MTGANCKLADLAESMATPVKKMVEVKIEEVAPTYELALENKELIIKYCKADGEVLYHIFEKFKHQICAIVVAFCDKIEDDNDPEESIWGKKIDIYLSSLDFEISKEQYISQFFPTWATISSLALKLFRMFFLKD
jgi:hypothetical protein